MGWRRGRQQLRPQAGVPRAAGRICAAKYELKSSTSMARGIVGATNQTPAASCRQKLVGDRGALFQRKNKLPWCV